MLAGLVTLTVFLVGLNRVFRDLISLRMFLEAELPAFLSPDGREDFPRDKKSCVLLELRAFEGFELLCLLTALLPRADLLLERDFDSFGFDADLRGADRFLVDLEAALNEIRSYLFIDSSLSSEKDLVFLMLSLFLSSILDLSMDYLIIRSIRAL